MTSQSIFNDTPLKNPSPEVFFWLSNSPPTNWKYKTVLDKVLTEGEDAVMALNIPNRWQEFLVRRGAFLGELERLVKREYKIDFIDALNQGKIREI